VSEAPLIAYYGDDFTGSTDVLEALSSHGIETVLFTRMPDEAGRRRFADYRGIGLAGTSRSQSPEWMDRELPQVFAWLRSLGAGVVHYKVCSTFDSAPHRGSIGRAMEIGLSVFGQDIVPIIVGAPELRRYTVFGQLFAAYQSEVFRIDRHPVMSRHPATPMDEADLLQHLSRQTPMPLARIDLADLIAGREGTVFAKARAEATRAVLVDVYDHVSQASAGRLLAAELSASRPLVFGSSGVEYALLRVWSAAREPLAIEPLTPVARTVIVSASCSPVTATQIHAALAAGFTGVALNYEALATGVGAQAAFDKAVDAGRAALHAGGSPIFYTALGPGDARASTAGASDDRVGQALGRLLRLLVDEFGLLRVGVAGGDTSGHALSELDIHALTLRYPIAQSPGSPVCLGHRETADLGAVEIVLKGGQIGQADFFIRLRDGKF
jgi:uncharacterized protein YgbK (DUF1537 family)